MPTASRSSATNRSPSWTAPSGARAASSSPWRSPRPRLWRVTAARAPRRGWSWSIPRRRPVRPPPMTLSRPSTTVRSLASTCTRGCVRVDLSTASTWSGAARASLLHGWCRQQWQRMRPYRPSLVVVVASASSDGLTAGPAPRPVCPGTMGPRAAAGATPPPQLATIRVVAGQPPPPPPRCVLRSRADPVTRPEVNSLRSSVLVEAV